MLIQQRTSTFRNNPTKMGDYWFHYLEDKIAGYLLTVGQNYPAPQIKACATDVAKLQPLLTGASVNILDTDGKFVLPTGTGIVIKATNFHSNQGVFILVNDGKSSGAELKLKDLITEQYYTFNDVKSMLASWQATKIIVEELVGGELPDEYKFHVINGKIQSIDIIMGRGSDCPCYGVVDKDFNRMDYNGCFEPAGNDQEIMNDNKCTAIDFTSGKRKAGPVKKDMYICDTITKPKQCIVDDMVSIAESLSKTIGVYMRIDMFVAGDQVYVQEYSANPMNGLRHCASKVDSKGCVDSCFMGREWKAAGGPNGGAATVIPTALDGFLSMDPAKQCELATQANTESMKGFTSSCTAP